MENISFLKKILMSDCEYWIAARRESVNHFGSPERSPDSIWFISIPTSVDQQQTEDSLLLKDIEGLQRKYVCNIAITDNYPPFQNGKSMYEFYEGFPVKSDVKGFLIKALQLGSTDIWEYKKILDEMELKTEQQ